MHRKPKFRTLLANLADVLELAAYVIRPALYTALLFLLLALPLNS